jgi:hypothetical protein
MYILWQQEPVTEGPIRRSYYEGWVISTVRRFNDAGARRRGKNLLLVADHGGARSRP